ncbi:MAG: flagellar hook-basal body protein [Limisphaerales bacterium]
MNVSLYQAAAAMNAQNRWMDAISGNLASSALPGYKKQEVSFSAVAAGLMPGNGTQRIPYVQPTAKSGINFQPGELKFTGSPTDIALEGRGFFSYQLADGRTGYTRDGEFKMDTQGRLVTKQGLPVLGEGGPIMLDTRNPAPISITPNGDVTQGADRKGRLRVVDFPDPGRLTPVSGANFVASEPGIEPQSLNTPSIRQGFLEASNTSSVTEMVKLIGAMRSFEANQRIVQMQDERMGRAISELGNGN